MQFKFNGAKISDEYKTTEELGMVDNDIIECSEATVTIKVIAENADQTVYNEVKKSTQMSDIFDGKNDEMLLISLAGYFSFIFQSFSRLRSRRRN